MAADNDKNIAIHEGMTLRDWFAGQAATGAFLAGDDTNTAENVFARRCYELADALLKARKLTAAARK